MKIICAKNAGFCFGVARAVETIESLTQVADKRIYTLGPVIHNRQVVEELCRKGVIPIDDISEPLEPGYIVIRAHGACQDEYERIKEAGHDIIDLTCPYVRKIQLLVKEKYNEGFQIVIVGDKTHPEVIAINGWCGNSAVIIGDSDEVGNIPSNAEKICVVAQTTTVYEKWSNITGQLEKLNKTVEKFDTICNATIARQEEGAKIASEVDMMVVVGGSGSSNTQKLFQTCAKKCPNTIKVETANDIDGIDLTGIKSIGITAGTSTPGRIIREVAEKMEELKNEEAERVESVEIIENTESVESIENSNVEIETQAIETAANETSDTEEAEKAEVVSEIAIIGNAAEDVVIEEAAKVAEAATEEAEASTEEAAAATEEAAEAIEAATEEAAEKEEDAQEVDPNKEESFEEALQKSLLPLRSGTSVKGTIVRFDETDIYVNLNFKYEGVIPIAEYSSDKAFDPASLKIGDEIEIFVLRVNEKDGIVNLSRRVIEEKDNWESFKNARRDKTAVKVKVTSVTNGGLNAVAKGIKIFIPASQASSRFTKDLAPLVGTEAMARIIEVDQKKKKVVASIRVVQDEEKSKNESNIWETIETGKEYEGIVSGLTDFGAFVDIGGVDGLVHITELSWKKIKHPSEVAEKGDRMTVRILDFDKEKKRVSLGYKKAEDNPWNKAAEKYHSEDVIKGKVVRILPFGAFIEIENGLDGLVHISQISNKRLKKVEEVLKIGQEVDAKIIEVDGGNMRINLSIKAVEPMDPPERHEEKKPEKIKTEEVKPEEVKPEEAKPAVQNEVGETELGKSADEVLVKEESNEHVTKEKPETVSEKVQEQAIAEIKAETPKPAPAAAKAAKNIAPSAGKEKAAKEPYEKIPNFHKEELSNTIGDFLGDLDLSEFRTKESPKDGE